MLKKSMRSTFTFVALACFVIGNVYIGSVSADTVNNGILMQPVNSGNQSWAYYPYSIANPLSGGSYSPVNNGTSWFTVTPGTVIYRKYIVINNEPNNDSVSYSVTGIPPGWGLLYTTYNALVLGTNYTNKVGTGASSSKQGYGSIIVTVPAGTAPGKYPYTIKAVSGTGYTSTLSDSIIVGNGSPYTPAPDSYNVSSAYESAVYNGTTGPLAQFNVTTNTTVQQGVNITNTGTTPDSYAISVTGIPAGWYKIIFSGSDFLNSGVSCNATVAITPATAGTYPITITAASNNNTSVFSIQNYTLNAVSPSQLTPVNNSTNMLYDPSFENGYLNTSVWIGGQLSNYKDNQIIVTSATAHSGNYSAVGAKNDYSRAAQNVTYYGHGFDLSAWFYINLSDPTSTSEWVGILNTAAVSANIDNLTFQRAVGYNNRTNGCYHEFQFMSQNYHQQNLSQITESGWYKGQIFYDGTNMTFSEYDSMGNLISSYINYEPGFEPKAVVINPASTSQYIDDLYYTTW